MKKATASITNISTMAMSEAEALKRAGSVLMSFSPSMYQTEAAMPISLLHFMRFSENLIEITAFRQMC
jgi:hypothetical protein